MYTNRPMLIDSNNIDLLMQNTVTTNSSFVETKFGIRLIYIDGILSRGSPLRPEVGTYEWVKANVLSAVNDQDVRGIILVFNTPGGDANGVFETARLIRKSGEKKPIWGVVRDMATSAGYALACACSRLYATETASVGGVGVLAVHIDQTARDHAMGYKYSLIHAGTEKTLFNPHLPLDQRGYNLLKAEVDRLYEMFCNHVVAMRSLPKDFVVASQGRIFYGDQVVPEWCDQISTLENAVAEMLGVINTGKQDMINDQQSDVNNNDVVKEEDQRQEEEEVTVMNEMVDKNTTMDSVLVIAEMCEIAGLPHLTSHFLRQFLNNKISIDDVRSLLLQEKQKSQQLLSNIIPPNDDKQQNVLLNVVKKMYGGD